jgi:serine/threonine-protein kinase
MTVGDAPRDPRLAGDTIRDVHVKRCTECGARFGAQAAFCPFDGTTLAASTWNPSRDPLTGTVVENRYEVLEPLGEGGMGTVYRVRHVALDRFFAMKVLRRDLAADAALAARFVQEARATAAIRHPSVVAITDFGELDTGVPYFVMELLVGETLAARLRGRGPMAPSEVIDVARKIASALEASHAAGVIHRDLKPENVFLVGKALGRPAADEIRIVDFGAAKVASGSKLTRPGIVFGTPYYMSPEQAGGEAVDGRADIYSLGVLVYELLTGSVPFEADTYMGVLTKHMFAAPVPPSERVPSGVLLGELEDIVLRMLAKDPSNRYASMMEVEAALAEAAKGRPSTRVPRGGAPASPHATGFTRTTTADRIEASVARAVVEDERRRRRTVTATIAAALATAVVVVALLLAIGPRLASHGDGLASPAQPSSSSPSISTDDLRAAASANVTEPPAAAATSTASPSHSAALRAPKPRAPHESVKAPASASPPRSGSQRGPQSASSQAAPAQTAPQPARTGDDFVDPWTR